MQVFILYINLNVLQKHKIKFTKKKKRKLNQNKLKQIHKVNIIRTAVFLRIQLVLFLLVIISN